MWIRHNVLMSLDADYTVCCGDRLYTVRACVCVCVGLLGC